jgi:hypothetical protein
MMLRISVSKVIKKRKKGKFFRRGHGDSRVECEEGLTTNDTDQTDGRGRDERRSGLSYSL